VLIVTEIYAASEDKIEGISGSALAERIRKSGHKNVLLCTDKEDVAEQSSRSRRLVTSWSHWGRGHL